MLLAQATTSYDYSYDYSSGAGNVSPEAAAGIAMLFGGLFLVLILFFLVVYVYMAICLMKIAKKTGTPNAWLAWIPIGNFVLTLQIAQKPVWWVALIILAFIPFINFLAAIAMMVVTVLVWMAIAERLGKPNWLGILMIVPIANLIVSGYLAFSKDETPGSTAGPSQSLPPIPPVAPQA